MGQYSPVPLAFSWTFLAFLLEQEIHYPLVDYYSDHSVWSCLLTMLTQVFVCVADTKLAKYCCKKPITFVCQVQAQTHEAGATMKQSTGGNPGYMETSSTLHSRWQTKPTHFCRAVLRSAGCTNSKQIYDNILNNHFRKSNISRTDVTALSEYSACSRCLCVCWSFFSTCGVSLQFNRKKGPWGTQTPPGSSHTSLTSGRWGRSSGGKGGDECSGVRQAGKDRLGRHTFILDCRPKTPSKTLLLSAR